MEVAGQGISVVAERLNHFAWVWGSKRPHCSSPWRLPCLSKGEIKSTRLHGLMVKSVHFWQRWSDSTGLLVHARDVRLPDHDQFWYMYEHATRDWYSFCAARALHQHARACGNLGITPCMCARPLNHPFFDRGFAGKVEQPTGKGWRMQLATMRAMAATWPCMSFPKRPKTRAMIESGPRGTKATACLQPCCSCYQCHFPVMLPWFPNFS